MPKDIFVQKRLTFKFLCSNFLQICLGTRGIPVDQIDTQCKKLGQCESCLKMDFGAQCSPTAQGYSFSGLNGRGTNDTVIRCNDPKGTCARALCECDIDFAKKQSRLLDTEYQRKFSAREDPTKHAFEDNCRAESNENDDDDTDNDTPIVRDMCCGIYPNRSPAASQNGTRKCCGNRTYALEYFKCCDGGQVKGHDQTC